MSVYTQAYICVHVYVCQGIPSFAENVLLLNIYVRIPAELNSVSDIVDFILGQLEEQ